MVKQVKMAEFFDDQGRADDADDSNDSFIFPRARSRPSRLVEEFTATSASVQQSGRGNLNLDLTFRVIPAK